MKAEYSKQSANKRSGKIIDLDLEENYKKPPTCPKCGNKDFEGFSTGFGPYRRCLKPQCRFEWPCGGFSEYILIPKDIKEHIKEIHNDMAQDEAYNKIVSMQEDMELIENVKDNERLSGSSSNKDFWNRYMSSWDQEYED